MYKHNACSPVITPSFSFSLSLSHSVHFLHMFHPSLPPLSLSFHPSLLQPRLKFACKVMQSHRHTPVPAEATFHSFNSESGTRIFRTHADTHTHTHHCIYSSQTYFPINNACWPYCSQRSRQGGKMTETRKKPEGRGCMWFHKAENLNSLHKWNSAAAWRW